MRLIDHPAWNELKPHLHFHKWRIEVDTQFKAPLMDIYTACPHCGRLVHPLRQRQGLASVFLALTCPLTDNVTCARSGAARQAFKDLRIACQ